jgi:hypothetical protein
LAGVSSPFKVLYQQLASGRADELDWSDGKSQVDATLSEHELITVYYPLGGGTRMSVTVACFGSTETWTIALPPHLLGFVDERTAPPLIHDLLSWALDGLGDCILFAGPELEVLPGPDVVASIERSADLVAIAIVHEQQRALVPQPMITRPFMPGWLLGTNPRVLAHLRNLAALN